MSTIKQATVLCAVLMLTACDNVEWVSYPDDELVEAVKEETNESVTDGESAVEEEVEKAIAKEAAGGDSGTSSAAIESDAQSAEGALGATEDEEPFLLTP